MEKGFTQIQLNPDICCTYILPILVAITTLGFSFLQKSFRNGKVSTGSIDHSSINFFKSSMSGKAFLNLSGSSFDVR